MEAQNLYSSRGGREQASQHLDGGGFPRAIRSQEAEELARCDSEIHIFDRDEVSEAPRQAFGRNGRRNHETPDSSTTGDRSRAPAKTEVALITKVISPTADQTGTIGVSP